MTPRPLPLLALMLSLPAAPLLAAPPANDNFANRITLNSDTPSGSTTVDATMEGTEPFPGGFTAANYQGTVWWQWSPVFSGWHEINTTGSGTDTVLTIWTGATLGTLGQVHVNDNDVVNALSTSRIRINADQNTVYHISVASRNATRGAVSLLAFNVTQPFSRVTGATFTPATVNVFTAATVTADITLQSSNELGTSGLISLYNPSNAVLATAQVSAANRISGNVASGVYRMTLNLPQGSPLGTCRWGIKMARVSPNTTTSTYGWEGLTPLPFGVPASITTVSFDPFLTWANASGLPPGATRGGDNDSDGFENLYEYEAGLDPLSGKQQTLVTSGATITLTGHPDITIIGTGDQRRLRVVFLRRLGDPSVSATVQFSDDLTNWSNATNTPSVIATSSTHEALAVEDAIFIPAKTIRHAKVSYVHTP